MNQGSDTAQLTLPVLPCPLSIVVAHVLLETILLFCRFMSVVYISRPTQSRYTIVWDVKVVLDYFRQWKDNKELSLKELSFKTTTLVALVSAQRVQSLHKLDLDCMTQENDRIAFKFDL